MDTKNMIVRNYNEYRLRRGITQFVAEFTNQNFEDASEYNCEMIDWISSCIESSLEKE